MKHKQEENAITCLKANKTPAAPTQDPEEPEKIHL
jgi:hypothetical protein